jgi:hypothetical protein
MRRIIRKIAFLVIGLAAAGISAWGVGKYSSYASARRQSLVIERDDLLSSSIPRSPVIVDGGAGRWTNARMMPTAIERSVFYLVTGQKRERIWDLDHAVFAFVKGGDAPLSMLGTRLDADTLVVVYKEHGATRASIVKKDSPSPKGTEQWRESGTQTLTEDDDLDGAKVMEAKIIGVVSDQSMHIELSQARPGQVPTVARFRLDWGGAKPIWSRTQGE